MIQLHPSAFASITVRSPTQTFPSSKHPPDGTVLVATNCCAGHAATLNILPCGGEPHKFGWAHS